MAKHYDFKIKQGDTLPVIESLLTDSAGAAIDLTTATVVTFRMRTKDGGTLALAGSATILTPATAGRVRYTWNVADTLTPGEYEADWHITFSGGGTATFPNGSYLRVLIQPDVLMSGLSTTPPPTLAGFISGDANNALTLGSDSKLFEALSVFAGVKIYAVNQIYQSGTAVPTFVDVKNTLGFTPVWTRSATGQYFVTYAGGFPATKTLIFFSGLLSAYPRFVAAVTYDNDHIFINTYNAAGALSDGILFVCSLVVLVFP